MKIAVSVPMNLFAKAELLAQNLGLSRSELYVLALTELIARHRSAQVTHRVNEVYSVEDGGIDAALRAAQMRAMATSEW